MVDGMVKTYVIDTNVLIQAPDALFCFDEHERLLPLVVLEELDGLKKADGERGANARKVIRTLENLRLSGDILKGVPLHGGGSVRIEINCVHEPLPESLPEDKADNRILKVCVHAQKEGKDVILVTKDLVLRLKSEMLGIPAEDFSNEQVSSDSRNYLGRTTCYIRSDVSSAFQTQGVSLDHVYITDEEGNVLPPDLTENEFVTLRNDLNPQATQLGRVEKGRIVPLTFAAASPYGVKPHNVGQVFIQEALMMSAQRAPLVIVKGPAGTAKTFYSLAVGLEKVVNNMRGEYRKMLICRPNVQFDKDIGFLPGTEEEKISPLMRPIMDNLEQLMDSGEDNYRDEIMLQDTIQEIFEQHYIEMEAMNYLRGRSLVNTYLIIDEAQNMTPNQVQGIITRAGRGTKIILLGDPKQIDNAFLDERTNGLSYAAEKMKGSPLCWQITLLNSECERSALALDAIERF